MLKMIPLLMYLAVASVMPGLSTAGEVGIGQLLPNATLRGLNGPAKSLENFRGRPLIINVWASWCGPCRQEMASLERLAWREGGHDFAIIGISTDDDPGQALQLLKLANATISQFIDTRMQMERMLGASRLPLTVLVGADGRVSEKVYGARQWDGPEALKLIERAFHRRTTRAQGQPTAASPARFVTAPEHLAP
jgi:thiol-disulfide isomerase/thioredoxin